jgi:hypothetical protein
MKHIRLFLLLSLFLLGCTSHNRSYVTINALSANAYLPKTYWIMPGENLSKNDQIYYNKIMGITENVLSQHGFVLAKNVKQASQVIYINYSKTGPLTQTNNVTIPIFGNNSSYSVSNSVTTYNQSYGITGVYNKQITSTSYGVVLTMKSFDFQKYLQDKEVREIWNVQIIFTSDKQDSLATFSYIMHTAGDYIDMTLDKNFEYMANEEL